MVLTFKVPKTVEVANMSDLIVNTEDLVVHTEDLTDDIIVNTGDLIENIENLVIDTEDSSIKKPSQRIIFFDTETTGLGNYDKLVEIGWVITNEMGDVLEEYSSLIYPEGFNPERGRGFEFHGITKAMCLLHGRSGRIVLLEFLEKLRGCILMVGHNIDFDIRVVSRELLRYLISDRVPDLPKYCTMAGGRSLGFCGPSGRLKKPKLGELYRHFFGRDFDGAHRVLSDVRATKECYFKLIG